MPGKPGPTADEVPARPPGAVGPAASEAGGRGWLYQFDCAGPSCYAIHRVWLDEYPTGQKDGEASYDDTEVPPQVIESLEAAGWRFTEGGGLHCPDHAEEDDR